MNVKKNRLVWLIRSNGGLENTRYQRLPSGTYWYRASF